MLAWRTTTALDFLLKDGNPKRYIDVAQEVRSKMSEEQHAAISSAAEELTNLLFPAEVEDADGHSLH